MVAVGKYLSAGDGVWVDAPCPGGLRLTALPARRDGDPWAVAPGLSRCSVQGCHSRAHAVTAAPEQEETSTQFVQGAALCTPNPCAGSSVQSTVWDSCWDWSFIKGG